jgi:uncharacterized protein DUF4381
MNGAPAPALQLRDIHLPGDAPFWPPAPGWWLLAAIVVALLTWGVVLGTRYYRIHRRRAKVMAALARLETGLDRERTPEMLASISILLRRLALTRYPRERIAPLSGAAWLAFLDDSGGDGRFRDGPGKALESGPYQRALPPDLDVAGLTTLVRTWVRKNTKGLA